MDGSSDIPASTDPRIGSVLAGYRIESLLGRGGMSVVYVAEHLQLQRKAALKLLSPELAGDMRFRERFIRESRMAAALDHPNIVPIYEAGEADGLLFIAMRYVRGTDLKTLLARQGRLPPEQALEILAPVAAALDDAHAQDLVHRDVKPGNILIASGRDTEGSGHVYLSDFGITRRMSSRTGLTMTGQFVGTIDYAAPEQIQGGTVDGRTDQYALGCVLFECLTGRAPFVGESPLTVLLAHLERPRPRPSDILPALPRALDDVVGRAMATAPPDRFDSCTTFVRAARDTLGSNATTASLPILRESPTRAEAPAPSREAWLPPTRAEAPVQEPWLPPTRPEAPVSAQQEWLPPTRPERALEAEPEASRPGSSVAPPAPPSGAPPRRRRAALAWTVGAVVVVAGAAAIVLATRTHSPSGGTTPQPSSTAHPSAGGSAPVTAPPPGTVLFRDGFADPSSGWPTYQSSTGSASYADGAFRIDVVAANPQWSTTRLMPGRTGLTDVGVQVTATRLAGPGGLSLVGVLCRYADQNDTYLLGVKGDGHYLIAKRLDRAWTTLGSGKAPPGAVHAGSRPNVVRGDCTGSGPVTLTLWANGRLVGRATDDASPFTSGSVGIADWPLAPDGMQARFDDFELLRLS